MRLTHAVLVLCLAAMPAMSNAAPPAQPFVSGTVTEVLDGQTLRFVPTGAASQLLRLRDIEAPLACQPGSHESRQALSDLALRKPARVRVLGAAGTGPALATVLVDEADLSARQVEEGQAWSVRGRNGHGPLLKQEKVAQALKRGVHGNSSALPPPEFRRQTRC
jgi:micrococcal nuclease